MQAVGMSKQLKLRPCKRCAKDFNPQPSSYKYCEICRLENEVKRYRDEQKRFSPSVYVHSGEIDNGHTRIIPTQTCICGRKTFAGYRCKCGLERINNEQ